eukprot:SM000030S11438  [mRNA]  locus=s30:723855:725777:+ [translate_table: standard]
MEASRPTFTASEIEFQAENELISIVPNFQMDALYLLGGEYGPFRPQMPLQVPLWVAVALLKRQKCIIQAPEWMTLDNLKRIVQEERNSPREFQPLPFHYIEITKLLISNSLCDIQNKYEVETLLNDIKDVRFNKIETGLSQLDGRRHAVKLANVSAMEVNIIRAFALEALKTFDKIGGTQLVHKPPARTSAPEAASAGSGHRILRQR